MISERGRVLREFCGRVIEAWRVPDEEKKKIVEQEQKEEVEEELAAERCSQRRTFARRAVQERVGEDGERLDVVGHRFARVGREWQRLAAESSPYLLEGG